MWNTILDALLKSWVSILSTGVAGLAVHYFKKYVKLQNEELKRSQQDYHDAIKRNIIEKNQEMIDKVLEKSKTDDEILQHEIDAISKDMDSIKDGILSGVRKSFYIQCRRLLDENHSITLEEWEEVDEEHNIYNSLGGNHKGDEMFKLVKAKAANNIANN